MATKYVKVVKALVADERLKTWKSLNDAIRHATQKQCEELLKIELDGRNRRLYVLRIHSRLNRMRADQERRNLLERKKL